MTHSAYTDAQLSAWLRSEYEGGSNFMRAIAEAALLADVQEYRALRPVLIELRKTLGQDFKEASSE